ncbi:MAG: DnaD domain protein [Lachnospiraceae bacterium]|nr:DnaD domain protein [Lachnospiraceae bacterium]
MNKLRLNQKWQSQTTVLSNEFIDQKMISADGEFVKIYILILSLLGRGEEVTKDRIADILEITRKDVERAIRYWEKEGVLQWDSEGMSEHQTAEKKSEPVTDHHSAPPARTVPGKQNLSPVEMRNSIADKNLDQILYVVETYFGRPLTAADIQSLVYIRVGLGFSEDLLEYLIEYCATRQKFSMRYAETTAINWYRESIDTVEKAKIQTASYVDNVFPIMKAFGLDRKPGEAELNFIKSWNQMGMDSELLVEACSRSLLKTHEPSFNYANKILTTWQKEGVRTMRDVKRNDADHRAKQESQEKKEAPKGNRYSQTGSGSRNGQGSGAKSNSFHNFEERDYDYNSIEAQLYAKKRRQQ